MKSKKRHQTSSDESVESDASVKSSSSSDSESEESSDSDHRHKKKRKRADSSISESESDDQKRKKRKHKKKKKKHGKKKRRSVSVESVSVEEISMSEGEISSKKKRKHKHKHSKRARSSASEDAERDDRRLHSVVKERRASSEEGSQPSRTYYQRDYRDRRSGSGNEPAFDREREVQRFYRGSSKDRSHHSERFEYERERSDKYSSYQDKSFKAKYQSGQYANNNEEYVQKQRQYDEYRRHQRYDERKPTGEYHGRPREEHHSREDPRGYNNHRFRNQYEGQKRHDYQETREYHNRRPPPEHGHYREKEYPDKRERYQENYSERPREPPAPRRDRPPAGPDKPVPPHREYSRSRSPDERYKERSRRPEEKEERYRERGEERAGEGRGDERRRSPRRPRSPRPDRARDDRPPPPLKTEPKPRERRTRFEQEDNKEYSWGKADVKKEGSAAGDKEKPNFGLSGKLTADTNTVNGVVIKYSEPDDAKQPKRRWRFYPFKGDKALPILYIHRQSAFLIGRDKKVVDISLEHPSISKQHAALQYRATPFTRPDGSTGRRVRPYIIDLDSANGTFVNNKKVEPRRYVELLERDVVKFGFSQREYVLLHENSKDDAQDDDNQDPAAAPVTTTDKIKQEKRAKQEIAEDGE